MSKSVKVSVMFISQKGEKLPMEIMKKPKLFSYLVPPLFVYLRTLVLIGVVDAEANNYNKI